MAKRDIIATIQLIKQTKFESAIGSDLVVNLLWSWSVLFNNGQQPSWCAKCIKRYYNEIINEGENMAQKYLEVQNRTCKPKWNGLKYIQRAGKHYNDYYITDKEAIDLLNKGLLGEKDFEILPIDYVNSKKIDIIEAVEETIEAVIEAVETIAVAPKNKKKSKKK